MQGEQEYSVGAAAAILYSKTVDRYKRHLAKDPYLKFKTFCKESHVNYQGALRWASSNDISIVELRDDAIDNATTQTFSNGFIQFVPSAPTSPASETECMLRDVSLTFPDGVNLSLKECSAASVVRFLDIYRERQIKEGGK